MEVFDYGRFGAVSLVRGGGEPRDVVLFLSGDGGWNGDVVSLARRLADRGAVVAGIDLRRYLGQLETAGEQCVSPATDFENLSRYVQSKLKLKTYLQPTLVGYSSGATVAYAALVQSPAGLFKGALSVAFCPELDLKKPLCKGSGIESTPRADANGVRQGVKLLPAKQLPGPWISLQSESDTRCAAAAARAFIAAVPGAEILMLPKQGYAETESAYERVTAPRPQARASLPALVSDLPLTVVPAAAGSGPGDWFGVFLTGDGGWVALDQGVAAELAKHNIPIVGWDSLKYFWSPRTPEGAAKDLDRVLRHFSRALGRTHALLIGYSQGADTMPFMVNRLPAATRSMVGLTTLLGISDNAAFEFHVANWVGTFSGGLPTGPELQRWSGSPYLCLYGADDKDAACKQLTGHDGSALEMHGGHHFGGSYARIADIILARLPKP